MLDPIFISFNLSLNCFQILKKSSLLFRRNPLFHFTSNQFAFYFPRKIKASRKSYTLDWHKWFPRLCGKISQKILGPRARTYDIRVNEVHWLRIAQNLFPSVLSPLLRSNRKGGQFWRWATVINFSAHL